VSFGFDHPWVLLLLPIAVLPLVRSAFQAADYPSLSFAPIDRASLAIDALVKAAGVVALVAIVLALAGVHRTGHLIERTGTGARIVLLIDRSSSMNDSFANRQPSDQEESKSAVAKRLILDFIERRPRDRIGVALFSTRPMEVLPLTDRHEAVKAAVASIDRRGLTMTDAGLGLVLAISMLAERDTQNNATGGGAVVLVSDGASVVSPRIQETLRQMAAHASFNLYWLFLRSEGSRGIFAVPGGDETDSPYTNPERHLHKLLGTLGVPYRAFEAGTASAVEEAVREIDRQESRPLRYVERTARRDLSAWAYGLALAGTALLLLARLVERQPYALA
jgi:mxaC protein